MPPGTVQQEAAQSTRVFLGRVISIEERTPLEDKGWLNLTVDWFKELFGVTTRPSIRDFPYRRVTFAVTQTFKGTPVKMLSLTTGMGGGDCGYSFDAGEDYVVYAHGKEDALGAGICSLTGPASDPNSGLAILRSGS